MREIRSTTLFVCVISLVCFGIEPGLHAQSNGLAVLHTFSSRYSPNTDGSQPLGGLIVTGHTLCGTASLGGSGSAGTVFMIKSDGSGFTNVYSFTAGVPDFYGAFTNDDGGTPIDVVIGGNTLYGASGFRGPSEDGTLFEVNTNGSDFTIIHTFSSNSTATNGINADGGFSSCVVLLSNTLYAAGDAGGAAGYGTVSGVNTDGSDITNLHSFVPGSSEIWPSAFLIISGNTLFGTTGGAYGRVDSNYGAVFRMNTDGSCFTNLHVFTNGNDGADPFSPPTLSGGTLYGTTGNGGSGDVGTVFSIRTDGSAFRTLHSFAAISGPTGEFPVNSDGAYPSCALVSSGNTLYGGTLIGGSSGTGTLFRIDTNGLEFTNLYNFSDASLNGDGVQPVGNLVLLDNTLYGATAEGGSNAFGTIFALTLPAPELGIAFGSSQVRLSWPEWAGNFILETATDLLSGNWTGITNGITSDGTNYFFTPNQSDQTAFFRLHAR